MHTMNTMHAMTGSYGMHAMLEENGNPERCFAGAVAGRLWPDRNPCLVPIICLTLHGSNLLPLSRKRDCRSRAGKSAGWRIYRRLPIARCVSVCRKIRPPETSAPSAGDGMGSTPKSSNLKIKNAMAKKIKGRPRSADPCKYHYNFKLNEAQNKRFLDMLEQSGCTDNKSRFILSRLFG